MPAIAAMEVSSSAATSTASPSVTPACDTSPIQSMPLLRSVCPAARRPKHRRERSPWTAVCNVRRVAPVDIHDYLRYLVDKSGSDLHLKAGGPGYVRIDGELYWDGGIYSNTPIEVVLDDKPRRSSLIFSANVWHPRGPEPESIMQVLARHKDIQFGSRANSHVARQKQIHRMRHIIRELGEHIPASKRDEPDVRELLDYGCASVMHVIPLSVPRLGGEDHTKDIDFSPHGIRARWEAGYADTTRALRKQAWIGEFDPLDGVILHEPASEDAEGGMTIEDVAQPKLAAE